MFWRSPCPRLNCRRCWPMAAGLGITLVMNYFVEHKSGDEAVGQLLFRVFKFRPANNHAAKEAPAKAPRPPYLAVLLIPDEAWPWLS